MGAMLWVRFYSPTEPGRVIQPDEEVTEENIRFEICDTVPVSFPDYETLPDYVQKSIKEGFMHKIAFDVNYIKRTYDPNYWKIEFKRFLDLVIEKNRKAEERAARRQAKPKQIKRKIPVNIPGDLVYFPDLTFTLTFGCDITDEMVEDLEDAMKAFNDQLEEGLQLLVVEKTDDRCCEITIDFGRNDPITINGVINAIEKSNLDIVKIVIE